MKIVLPLFTIGFAAIALLFALASMVLLSLAVIELWRAVSFGGDVQIPGRVAQAIESIGLLAVALMALEMSQTVLEEEVVRRVHVSAPTRVRRYVSRFLVVIVVALAIESLVGVVQALHVDTSRLPHAAAVGVAAAVLLVAWGAFVRLNRAAEELEPEGIGEAKREDEKVQ
jgi:hypothetical protein